MIANTVRDAEHVERGQCLLRVAALMVNMFLDLYLNSGKDWFTLSPEIKVELQVKLHLQPCR